MTFARKAYDASQDTQSNCAGEIAGTERGRGALSFASL